MQGKDGSTKKRSRREALSLDWTMQHKIPRLKGSICAGETGDGLDAARTVASVSPLHVVTMQTCGPSSTTYTPHAQPQQKHRHDVDLLIIPTRGGCNGVAWALQHMLYA
ncbi:hypothetical protein LA080_010377 [Diaporthe eres]|nr:hypothetical protein LA080_010377 [Diaporthe eres]